MKVRAIQEEDFRLILDSDKKVYPTNSPVTSEIIKSWYLRNPEFGMIFEDKNGVVGMFIVIPLNKTGWEQLINGKLKESDMNSDKIFDNSRDKEIGLHFYHVEKFDVRIKDFYKLNLVELNKIIQCLRNKNSNLKICGVSALCVTAQGIGLFENKFNGSERKFISDEHILEKAGNNFVVFSKKEAEEKIKQGYKYKNKCKMLVLYPKENSMVWDYLK